MKWIGTAVTTALLAGAVATAHGAEPPGFRLESATFGCAGGSGLSLDGATVETRRFGWKRVTAGCCGCGQDTIFADGFESGDDSAWAPQKRQHTTVKGDHHAHATGARQSAARDSRHR